MEVSDPLVEDGGMESQEYVNTFDSVDIDYG